MDACCPGECFSTEGVGEGGEGCEAWIVFGGWAGYMILIMLLLDIINLIKFEY